MGGFDLVPKARPERVDYCSHLASPSYPSMLETLRAPGPVGNHKEGTLVKTSVSRADLPALIGSVHAALSDASSPAAAKEELTPRVPINKTIRPDYIISLEDGRHSSAISLRAASHRSSTGLNGGLRSDYPMVAPSYSKARSELARALGLIQKAAGWKRKPAQKG